MGLEAARYKDKHFWMHSGTVEYWYTVYFRILAKRSDNFDWEIEFAKKIKKYIEHPWIEGTLYSFDDYFSAQDRLNRFISTLKEVNKYIKDLADKSGEDVVRIEELDYAMDKCVLLSEMDMFYKLFAHTEEVPDGFRYDHIAKKWVKA